MKDLLKDSLLNAIVCFFGILFVDWISVPLLNQTFSNGLLIDLSYSVALGLFYFSIRSDYELEGLKKDILSKSSLMLSLLIAYISFSKDIYSQVVVYWVVLIILLACFPFIERKFESFSDKSKGI